MFLSTSSQTNARVQRAFPSGAASEDARALIGTAPAPPDDRAPDRTSVIVIEIELSTPVAVAAVLDEAASQPESAHTFIKGLTADGAWQHVKDRRATGPYTHVAVEIMFLDHDAPVPRLQVERQIRWARGALGALADRPPTESMTSAAALARANAAFDLRASFEDHGVDVGVMVVAPEGKRFAGRLVWDVAYSAGFRWGDGDYFHWVPSPETDVSQGIGMGTTTGLSYFMPEWVDDLDDLEMSFNVARTFRPDAVFEVMLRAANYIAQRLGGTVLDRSGEPFDEAAARARVDAIVASIAAADLVPGSGLALQVF
ncbi:MAG: hypothetical protein H0T46_19525 [Deltaproteobacteria bacterium]|nr:hypothetical protein [Deltaproteobacteria bacterium]